MEISTHPRRIGQRGSPLLFLDRYLCVNRRSFWPAHRLLDALLSLCPLLFIALPAIATAQTAKVPASPAQLELIARSTANELEALQNPAQYQYQERLEWTWGAETRSVIETAEGRVDRIVLFRDEPVSPDQKAKQEHRLRKLLSDRDAVKNELQDQKSEIERRIRMIRAFPRAFFFDFAGRKNGLLCFDFRPDPEFSPKDRETQMYRGMEGKMWLEPEQERIVQIQGKLVKDVSFGWGILGRLSKGGIYEITQTELSPGRWRVTTLNVDVKGRTLLVNSFHFTRRENNSHFHRVPSEMTYLAAVQALLDTPNPPDQDEPANSHKPTRSSRDRQLRH